MNDVDGALNAVDCLLPVAQEDGISNSFNDATKLRPTGDQPLIRLTTSDRF
jgi:hypothetical protein